jgi:hypothetical protein
MKPVLPLLPVLNIGKLTSYQGNPDKQQTSFSPGQILQGRIIGRENNQIVININGREFKTADKTSLQTGERLYLQVTATTPQISLKIINDSLLENISRSLHLLATGSSPGSLLASLASRVSTNGLSKATIQSLAFFSSFLPTSKESANKQKQQTDSSSQISTSHHKQVPDGQQLKQLFNQFGLNLEQLFATGKKENGPHTIKSALLDIIRLNHGSKSVQQAQQLLATTELFQMLHIRFAIESIFFHPLPLPFIREGYLLAEADNKKVRPETDNEIKKYSLHLNLEGLGNLKVELTQQENGLHIRFFAEDRQRTRFLAESKIELQKKLTDIQLESVQFLTGAENPTRTLMKMLTGKSSGTIDTSAV